MRSPSFILGGIALSALLCPLQTAALNITIHQQDVSFPPPGGLPPPGAASSCDVIIEQFATLGRTTVWDLKEKIHVDGITYEPEGMVRMMNDAGEVRFYVAINEYIVNTTSFGNGTIINGTDRSAGAGFAHMVVFNGTGARIADATLTEIGDLEYHNGGMDYDGQYIWATTGQLRPNSSAHVVKIDPVTLEPTTLFHVQDHMGGIVHDVETGDLITLGWGSRNASRFNLNYKPFPFPTFTPPRDVIRNPSYFIDYQDCKFLGHAKAFDYRAVMMCSGITTFSNNATLGGLAIVDMRTMTPLYEVPITMLTDLGGVVSGNAMDVAVVNGRMRVYWMQDWNNSTIYGYEPRINSPFEYGGTGGELRT